MKKSLFAFALLVLLCSSCQREVKKYVGDYSYKTSGVITITEEDGTESQQLISKNGQMNIRQDNTSDDANRVMITMNEMSGTSRITYGTIADGVLTFDPNSFETSFSIDSGSTIFGTEQYYTYIFHIDATGTGHLTDDILTISEQWTGYQRDNENIRLSANYITTLAIQN